MRNCILRLSGGLIIASLLCILTPPSGVLAQDNDEAPRVLVVLRGASTFMIASEFDVMRQLLQQAGFKVFVATITGEPISAGRITVTPDFKIKDVDAAHYAAFLLPCMAAGNLVVPEAVTLVKNAAAAGKPIAAQRGSVLTLARAGLLNGKKYTYDSDMWDAETNPDFKGSTYAGIGVVQDGNIITSGTCPMVAKEKSIKDGTEELTRALITAVKAKQK